MFQSGQIRNINRKCNW